MAFSSVAVCVVVDDGQPVDVAVAAALAPFDMNAVSDGQWDRWHIDGRRAGYLPLRAGCEEDPRVVRVSKPPAEWDRDRCDAAPRGLLDFTGDRAAARLRAQQAWAEWYEIAGRYPAGRTIDEFHARYERAEARRAHMEQPVMRAYMARYDLDPDRMMWGAGDPIRWFGYDQDVFVRNQVARVTPSEELLRLDGVWVRYAAFEGDHERAWNAYFAAADTYLEQLPVEAYIVRVQIHC